ncbi:MAG: ornithine carbamoyltransferase [Acidimicrobiia bacterium]|nr:ornithine carbamoyltransferase [Acidimicrobiia bacterium]
MANFLRVGDLDTEALVARGLEMKADPGRWAGSLAGKSVALFFEKPSTRTRISTEVAAAQLGMHPVVIGNESVGLGSRETPADVVRVMGRYVDLAAMRVFSHESLEAMRRHSGIPLVNLLSDLAHPCQAIADLMTIAERRPLEGSRVAYIGDGNNVCISLARGLARTGGRLTLACPPGYEPPKEEVEELGDALEIVHDPAEAADGADALYTDVWTSMGQEEEREQRLEAFAGFQVDAHLFAAASPEAIFLHCLPAHRGEEVTSEIMEHPRSVVFDQAEHRLHSVKAILHTLLA